MTLALIPMAESPRRKGRPLASDDPSERQKRLAVATYRICHGVTAKEAADAFGVTPLTAKRWTKEALKLDGPEADILREIVCRRMLDADRP